MVSYHALPNERKHANQVTQTKFFTLIKKLQPQQKITRAQYSNKYGTTYHTKKNQNDPQGIYKLHNPEERYSINFRHISNEQCFDVGSTQLSDNAEIDIQWLRSSCNETLGEHSTVICVYDGWLQLYDLII